MSISPDQGGAIDNVDSLTLLSQATPVDIVGQWAGRELWMIGSAAGIQVSGVVYLDPNYTQETYHIPHDTGGKE